MAQGLTGDKEKRNLDRRHKKQRRLGRAVEVFSILHGGINSISENLSGKLFIQRFGYLNLRLFFCFA